MHNLLNKKNKSFLVSSAILLLLIIINIVYFYLNLKNYINSSNYAFNELFINYQAGLIRRGLLGEIFWIINKFLAVKPIVFFSYLCPSPLVLQWYTCGMTFTVNGQYCVCSFDNTTSLPRWADPDCDLSSRPSLCHLCTK